MVGTDVSFQHPPTVGSGLEAQIKRKEAGCEDILARHGKAVVGSVTWVA